MAFRNPHIPYKRAFSTSLPRPVRKAPRRPTTTPEIKNVRLENIPPYPYGENRFFKQSNKGLYGGAMIQFGNKISQGKNEGKTRRTWHPNIDIEKLWSDALQKELTIKVRHRVLRTIKKVGGLDKYLLGNTPARIKELGVFGWRLRWLVMQSEPLEKKFRAQRKRLGLPEQEQTFQKYWMRRRKNLEVERIHQLALMEEERRASEVDEDEDEVLFEEEEEEEGSFSDAEGGYGEEHGSLSEGVIKDGEKRPVESGPEEDKPRRFMQEQTPGREK
jgi:large subunit ribosomal protein L28